MGFIAGFYSNGPIVRGTIFGVIGEIQLLEYRETGWQIVMQVYPSNYTLHGAAWGGDSLAIAPNTFNFIPLGPDDPTGSPVAWTWSGKPFGGTRWGESYSGVNAYVEIYKRYYDSRDDSVRFELDHTETCNLGLEYITHNTLPWRFDPIGIITLFGRVDEYGQPVRYVELSSP